MFSVAASISDVPALPVEPSLAPFSFYSTLSLLTLLLFSPNNIALNCILYILKILISHSTVLCKAGMFVSPGFGSRSATGVAAVRCCQKLSPCPAKTIHGSSKRDVLLAKEGPIRNYVKASVLMMPWEG